MKPQKLILCGWGPYKDETEIDFTQLNTELFLITGQTGAGKTTLFDAIAYALFGMLSGEVREKGTVRSDFADEDTKTYVELFLTHKGQQYHIVRNPEYMRPKKKKNGESAYTKEKENAALTLPDGNMIAGNQDVTAKIEEILGMDGRQFRQISMIAQGEFARMLLASPAEKTAIFRELFGTGIYAAVQSRLKERSANLYRDYMNYRHKMEEDVALLSLQEEEWERLTAHEQPDYEAVEQYLTKYLADLKKEISRRKQAEALAGEELLRLKEELTKAKEINKRFDELDAARRLLEELEEKQNFFQEKKKTSVILQTAKMLAIEEKTVLQSIQATEDEKQRLEYLNKAYTDCIEEMKEQESLYLQKEVIRDGFAIRAQMEANKKNLCEASDKVEQTQEFLKKASDDYLLANQVFEEAKESYESADKMYKNAVIGIAARYVEEGKPCPVCGSLQHPNVAQTAQEVPDEKQLEQLKKKMEESRLDSDRLYERALRFKNEQKIFEKDLEKLKQEQNNLHQKEAEFPAEVRAYIQKTNADSFEKLLISYVENQSKAEEISRQIGMSTAEYEKKCTESRMSRETFDKKRADAGFADETKYTEAVAGVSMIETLEEEVRAYQDKLLATQEISAHLMEALKDCGRMDEAHTEQAFLVKQQGMETLHKELQQDMAKQQQVERSLLGVRKNRKEAEGIRAEYGIVKDLDELANGNNARRLVFEQYVLAGYFEQILRAANLRLIEMTSGRYELIRAKQVGDGRRKDNLEILVMDYYTGKERSVKTLSGGEIFKASLSLALGMSDCIQARNGGTQVETLFIDEGFGALDEESLEQSCAVLQSLAGADRMIGIISHVPELRERIESQIIIEKKNYGSNIKVRA